jgi:hypothetical protein
VILGFWPDVSGRELREDHGVALGRETLRQWMIEAGLWRDRKQRKRIHQPRPPARTGCRSTAASIGGSRTAGRNALCWCLPTTRPAD